MQVLAVSPERADILPKAIPSVLSGFFSQTSELCHFCYQLYRHRFAKWEFD